MTKTGLNVTTEQEIKEIWSELLDYAKQHATDHGWNSGIKWLQQAFNEYLSMSDEVPGYGMGGAPGSKHNREVLAGRIVLELGNGVGGRHLLTDRQVAQLKESLDWVVNAPSRGLHL
ncbi:MAG: hypothetical protein IJV44_03315 [Prevotella sp.]|nr:hypothetical protein [Prevotella sp.]